MGPYEFKGIDARILCCSGGRAEHKLMFFDAYYQEILFSYIRQFNDSAKHHSYSRTGVTELTIRTDTVIEYVTTIAKTINGVSYPGGGYFPKKKYFLENNRFGFIKFEELCTTPGIDANDVLIIPVFDISDMDDEHKLELIESSNSNINSLCNNPKYKRLFKLLKPLYFDSLTYKRAKYVFLSYGNLKIILKDPRYKKYTLQKLI